MSKFNSLYTKLLESCCKEKNGVLNINHDKKFVSICAWCDKNKSESKKWHEKGYKISHGICKACEDSMS